MNTQKANPKFIAILLHNIWESGYFEECCKKWIGQAGFDVNELANLELLLPCLELQNDIITKIDDEQALIEPSKQQIQFFKNKIQDRINAIFD